MVFERSTKPIVLIDEPALSHPREEVESSAITHIGYDEDSRILWVTFKPQNHSYKYLNVPLAEYERLMEEASIGKAFARNIKPFYVCEGEVLD